MIRLIVRQADISKEFPNGLQLQLEEDASVLDVIKAADDIIREKFGGFPVKGFRSLLQMVYHPHGNRFYNQVTIQSYTKSNQFLNMRENPTMPVPDGTTIILVPEGGCATDWEEPVE